MERISKIPHKDIHEINVYSNIEKTASAAARSILDDAKLYPSIPITFATGNTMIPVYKKIVSAGKSLEKIRAFHLDEYWPYEKEKEHSFVKFLYDRVFTPLALPEKNIFTLDGSAKDPNKEAERYENLIGKNKIGLAILGVGPGGHIGFNEAGTPFSSTTHLQKLSDETIFRDQIERGQDTPEHALTQGISTILNSERIILIAYGKGKGAILANALFGNITTDCPASALRIKNSGQKVSIFVDKEAASQIELLGSLK